MLLIAKPNNSAHCRYSLPPVYVIECLVNTPSGRTKSAELADPSSLSAHCHTTNNVLLEQRDLIRSR
jgi:hypothetical protein